MVYILKCTDKREYSYFGNARFPTILIRLAKLMVNMQYCRHIFGADGKYIDSAEKFLVYHDEKIDATYTVTPANGFIQFTGFIDMTLENVKSILLQIFELMLIEYPKLGAGEELVPFSYGSFHPTTHFTALFEITNEHWEKSILLNPSEAALMNSNNIAFIWCLYDPTRDIKVWIDTECVRTETQIYRDLVTIVVDMDILTLDEGLHFDPISEKHIKGHDKVIRADIILDKKYGIQGTLANFYLMPNIDQKMALQRFGEVSTRVYECPDFDMLPQFEKIYMWRSRAADTRIFLKELLMGTAQSSTVFTPEQSYIEQCGGCLDSTRRDICVACYVPLYQDIFAIQSVTTKKCVGVCPRCFKYLFTFADPLRFDPPCVIWKTIFPRTINRVIDDEDMQIAMQAYSGINVEKVCNILKMIMNAKSRKYNDMEGRFEITGENYKILVIDTAVFNITHYMIAAKENAIVVNGGSG